VAELIGSPQCQRFQGARGSVKILVADLLSVPVTLMTIDADAALGLPVDRLALHLLREIKATSAADPNWKPNRQTRLLQAYQSYSQNGLSRTQVTAATRALAEAHDWLLIHGLLSVEPGETHGWMFITRKGETVLAVPDGVQLVQAEARINVDMHPRIADRTRSQFLLGEYELAAFAAMREVEIRVRELAGTVADDDQNIGVRLMTRAFNAKEGGPLVDSSSDRGERVAMMNLFQVRSVYSRTHRVTARSTTPTQPLHRRLCCLPTCC
jgi:uncharacterized protein (TIGR02391 family)